MARIGIFFGLVLCGLTVAAISVTTQKSFTQFVPMMFGIPLLFLGVVGLNPHRRLNATMVAMTLGLLGFACGAIRFLVLIADRAAGGIINPVSFRLVVAMTIVCLVFALLALVWVRKRRERLSGRTNLEPSDTTPDSENTSEQDALLAAPDPSVSAAPDHEKVSPASNASANPYQSPRVIENPTESR
ncbi:hypothetical protein LOC71_12795 [Rhodopirellula sp. JC740]|uniref:Uncharacterized protein n=1 Tax=Rhodopirellula halodulae TaxID=2894198 RepID=A0ABS8NHX8_9BACT|nr:hypothetical protein [Rhodopirellula sp. JC740]MCC9643156.1 hypothetical protein [Rhodopirellula sp. JC740]